jgi:integrase
MYIWVLHTVYMALPKFYLEPRKLKDDLAKTPKLAINMFYSFYGQRLQYYTGIRLEPRFYKAGTAAKPTDKSDVNKLISESAPYASFIKSNLKQIALDAQHIANTAKANKVPVTKEYVKAELDKIHKHKPEVKEKAAAASDLDLISHFEKVIRERKDGTRTITTGKNQGKRFTLNSIKNYTSTLTALRRFTEYKKFKALPFEAVNKTFYEDFRKFCFAVEKKEVSTFAGYIKDIKSTMGEVSPDTFKAKEFVKPGYEADTIYLNDEQIDQIANLDLSDYTKTAPIVKDGEEAAIGYATLERVRDLALVGFYTGLRFSDFSNLEVRDIDGNFIKVKQIKTGGRVTIPIMAKLRPILAKYPDGLPVLSNQKFNSWIKIVAKLAGLTELKTLTNSKGNTQNKVTQPLYELISSHCCRRSYATNMFNKGLPTMLIMNSTGHKTEMAFLRYIKATNEDKAILMAEAMQKLGL